MDVNHTATSGQYYDYKNPADRALINGLALHAQWYDYVGWLGGIAGTLGVGIGNGIYYNNHRVR